MISDDLIINHFQNRKKIITEDDVMIFFDKDKIINIIRKAWFPLLYVYKNLIKVENKLRRKNISYYYLTNDDLQNIKFKFDDKDKPEFNKIYFKLDNYNHNDIRYYTYNKFIIQSENYRYDFIIYLFSKFGLKSMCWFYTNDNTSIDNSNKNIKFGMHEQNTTFQYNKKNYTNNNVGVEGFRIFENLGSINYFNTCDNRIRWYDYTKKNLKLSIKLILADNTKFTEEYYNKNPNIEDCLINRLAGASEIYYSISTNDYNKIIIEKMIKISNKYGSIGFDFKKEQIDTTSYTKNFKIKFFYNNKLEYKTLENLLNSKKIIYNIDMDKARKRFDELNQKEITKCNQEYHNIQRKLSEENKKKRFSMDRK